MNASTYQREAQRTLRCEMTEEQLLFNTVLGLVGEAGEIADYLKKVAFHQHELDRDKLIEELGDLAWYWASIATIFDVDLDDVLKANTSKLWRRYPDGFTIEASQKREA